MSSGTPSSSSPPTVDHPTPTPVEPFVGYNKRIGAKLEVIEELRSEIKEQINCPGIVVIGAQSSGKSSLLERLTGIAFPRDDGLCTRAPINVQLRTHDEPNEKYIIANKPGFKGAEKYDSMEMLGTAIRKMADAQDPDGSISKDPVYIRVCRSFDSDSLDMTLIDSPGLAEVDPSSKKGDDSISNITEEIVRENIDNPSILVLVVISALDDFQTSRALRIAREIDREGSRTIGVVTKIDLLPKKEGDFEDKIRMRRDNDVKLDLGFFAIKNRALNEEKSAVEPAEAHLFENHPQLRSLPYDQFGFPALRKMISKVQEKYVDRFIPKAHGELHRRLLDVEHELKGLPVMESSTTAERMHAVAVALRAIDVEIQGLIVADDIRKGFDTKADISINICDWMHRLTRGFMKQLREAVESYDLLGAKGEARSNTLRRQAIGQSLPNHVEQPVLKNLVREIFFDGTLDGRIDWLIKETKDNMTYVLRRVIGDRKELKPFPRLHEFLVECSTQCIYDAESAARKMTTAIYEAEAERLYTVNEDFDREVSKVINQSRRIALTQITSKARGQKTSVEQKSTEENNVANGYPDASSGRFNERRDSEMYTSSNNLAGSTETQDTSTADKGDGTEPQAASKADKADDGTNLGGLKRIEVPTAFVNVYKEAILKDFGTGFRKAEGLANVRLSAYIYADHIIRRLADVIPMLVHSVMVRGVNRDFHTSALKEFSDHTRMRDTEVTADENSAKMAKFDLFAENAQITDNRKKLEERKTRLESKLEKLKGLY